MYRNPDSLDPLVPDLETPPLAPRAASAAPVAAALAPLAAPMTPRNMQVPLIPSANAPRSSAKAGVVPLAPLAPAGAYNPARNINAENYAKAESSKYANEAFNKWYSSQEPGSLAQFAPPPGQMSSARIVNAQGQAFGTRAPGAITDPSNPNAGVGAQVATDPLVLEQMKRQSARNHFNTNVLPGDQGYQGLQAAATMAQQARQQMVPLATFQGQDQARRANDAQIGLVNAQASAVTNPQPKPADVIRSQDSQAHAKNAQDRLKFDQDKLASTERQAEAKNKVQLQVEQARTERLARQSQDKQNESKATHATNNNVTQAQSDYDDARLEYRDMLRNFISGKEVDAAKAEVEKQRVLLDAARNNRSASLGGGPPAQASAPPTTNPDGSLNVPAARPGNGPLPQSPNLVATGNPPPGRGGYSYAANGAATWEPYSHTATGKNGEKVGWNGQTWEPIK